MKLRFLGTGTSTGVPQMRCGCTACTSGDPRDKRLRTSAHITAGNSERILIDCGPDFRRQMLDAGCPDIDCLLLTHIHYDHVGGIDDMRPYCADAPGHHFPVYCKSDVARTLRERIPYCFAEHPYPGVPVFHLHEIAPDRPFATPGGNTVIPLPVNHYKLEILGFRIGGLSYITDCKTMPEETLRLIKGSHTLVINALRHEEHLSHMNLRQALDVIQLAAPEKAYLIHLSHDMGRQADVEPSLPEGVGIAYDGLEITIPE